MTLQQKILKIHGNPDYVYYHDGISGKCYRKTGVRTLSAGRVIEESQIATDMTQHESDPDSYPVVTFNSCATCQGIELYYSLALDHIDVKLTSTSVQQIQSTSDLFDITIDHISVNGDTTGGVIVTPDTDLFGISIDHISVNGDTTGGVIATPDTDLFSISIDHIHAHTDESGTNLQSGLATHNTTGRVYTEGLPGENYAPPEDHSRVSELSAWGYTDNSTEWATLPV